jgi:hypothetical protein
VSGVNDPSSPTPPLGGPPPGWTPPSAADRLRVAWQRRHDSDYIFDFVTALGWTVLSCGVYGYYVFYQLVRRSRDHNQRRWELLDAATNLAWEQAQVQGVSEELRPQFEHIADEIRALGELASEFRDPVLWVVLSIVSAGIAQYVGWVLLDGDLVKHAAAERAIEAELTTIYARLGQPIVVPVPPPLKGRHNVAGRIIATLASCGIYSLWWLHDLMVEGNAHFERNWQFEDELARASQSFLAA